MSTRRFRLGVELLRNPSSISVKNYMPVYAQHQPIDSTSVLIKQYNQPEITLEWDYLAGNELNQIFAIINACCPIEGTSWSPIFLNDYGYIFGSQLCRIVSAEVTAHRVEGSASIRMVLQGI